MIWYNFAGVIINNNLMHILNFIKKFPGEKECVLYFWEIRRKAGIHCHNCEGKEHIWINSKNMFECANCGALTDILAGTSMENSKLPLKYWFLSIYLLTIAGKPYTADDIRKKMDYLDYESISEMFAILNNLIIAGENKYNFDMLMYTCAKNPVVNR
jgi:hypothetical protein